MKSKKALLIIDMQKGSFTAENHRFDTAGVVERINKLSASFRDNEYPVIFIQHNGSRNNMFIPDTHDWELLSELIVKPGDLFIQKQANDSFYETDLHNLLMELKLDEIVITGCATDFCVESTIQSALTKNYNITVIKNAHTTGNRKHLTAEKVIEHYNWVWDNMIPTKGTIRVIDFERFSIDQQ